MSRSAGRCSNLSSGTAASFCQRVNLVASDAELFQAGGVVARRDPLLVRFPFRRHVRRALHLSPQFFALTLRSYPYSRIEPQCLVEESYQHASAWPGFPSVPAVPLL